MSKYTAAEILEKMQLIITTYNEERTMISDDRMGDLRAILAVGTYHLVQDILQPAYADSALMEIELERMEGRSFDRSYRELLADKKSPSMAKDLARQAMKMDEDYLKAMHNYSTAKQYVLVLSKLLDQANQVLNSMSKKTRV